MRLFTFDKAGIPTLGARFNDRFIDLSIATPEFKKDMVSVLEAGQDALDYLDMVLPYAAKNSFLDEGSIRYLPPIVNPQKILCVGLNYRDHANEGVFEVPEYPVFFARFAHTLVGHNQPLIKPKVSDKFDYEGELAVIIGQKAHHVKKAQALEVVAGYSIFQDASVRDYQRRTHQWTLGKNFDASGGFGPDIVMASALPEGAKGLRLTTTLNDEVMQDGNTADCIFDVASLIEALTETMTLLPGDVIITGTPAGVGFAQKPPRYLKEGDTCSITIEGIGTLTNTVKNEG